jgi:hypothetical protein
MRFCRWCGAALTDPRAVWCSKRCRQTAWRARCRAELLATAERPIRVAYADPPYPGRSKRYYGDQPTYGGEVDHRALIARLVTEYPDGWALSTAADALRDLLPLCPAGIRVCAWTKPHGVPAATAGLHNAWEPLLVWRGRQIPPGVRDHLSALPARGGGSLPGRKPLAFVVWMLRCLGLHATDTLDDLFPGSEVVSRVWAEASRGAPGDVSASAPSDVSASAPSDVSASAPSDVSPRVQSDMSLCPWGDPAMEDFGG